jgi:hypothetical protein
MESIEHLSWSLTLGRLNASEDSV